MSDVSELIAAFNTGKFLPPSPEVLNIVDLSRAVASLVGADGVHLSPGSKAIQDLIGPIGHLVFVLADGLGMNFIEELSAASFLSRHLATELRTVFPSSSAVALTSIATGEWPSQHGITGWWTHLPEIESAATILSFTKRSDGRSLNHHGVAPDQAFPVPAVMGRVKRDTLALFPEQIADSVYSTYFSGGKPRLGYRNLPEAIDGVISRVKGADCPTYTYLYTPRIDEVAHRHSVGRPEVRAAVADMDREMERLKSGIGDRARLLVCADHGFLSAQGDARHEIRASDPLMSCLRFRPSGDARVMYLHLHEGTEQQVRERFRQRFGERFLLINVDEAEEQGLFGPGPISCTTKKRLGDLIVVSRGADVIAYRPPGTVPRMLQEASHHSGLTPQEMRVPLIIA